MLLMKIDGVEGKCKTEGYESDGWFVIDSFNFGFNRPETKPEDKPKPKPKPKKGDPQGQPVEDDKAKKETEANKGERDDFSTMRISKQVDSTTVFFMRLAMEAAAKPGNEKENSKENARKADIHVVGSMLIEGKSVYKWVQLHLQNVHVTKWSVSASGDGRPSETVTLQYGRAAMCYQGTEGTALDAAFEDGWDQWDNKRWSHYDARRALEHDNIF